MPYKNNIIILTTGSSGSSVLAGLIAKQGFWLGEDTKKLNFDTYENGELVDLNIQLLEMAGFKRRDCNDLPPPSIENVKALKHSKDLTIFKEFVQKCKQNSPWLWKDPRLSYTIHFWAMFEEVRDCNFIFIDRDPKQSYSGLVLSRKIPMSYRQQLTMNTNYKMSCDLFFEQYDLPVYQFLFEDLIMYPEKFIRSINENFDFNITMDDLRQIYRGNLYQKRYNKGSFLKARFYYFLYRFIKKDYIKFPRDNL